MHPLEHLEFSTRVAKRAQYEALDISLCGTDLLVRNESHANPERHEYIVSVADGIPVACSCPADARFDGACKHRVGAAIRRPLLETLQCVQEGQPPLVADGGVSQTPRDASSEQSVSLDSDAAKRETCIETDDECSECRSEFPCWECYRTGKADFV